MSRPAYTFEAFRMTSRDTPEAIYVRNPSNPLTFFFLPKEAVIHMSKMTEKKGYWSIEIPESLAEEKGLI